MTNVKTITIIIASLLIGAVTTYSWNNQTLSEMVEEHNQEVLADCLTKARIQKTAKEILEYASNCNKDILTNLSTPRSVETITGTHSTGNTVPPLGFQLIPQASASPVEKKFDYEKPIIVSDDSYSAKTVEIITKVRTPKQIYEQVNCNTECKIETITNLGINSNLANLIVTECKEGAIDPVHCIKVASSIIINESGGGKSNACINRFNCFGFGGGKIKYTSYQESVANFVNTYSRKWYKAKNSSFFYPNKGEYSPSRYCVSEQSSNSEIGCPFGQKHMQNTWNKLEKLF